MKTNMRSFKKTKNHLNNLFFDLVAFGGWNAKLINISRQARTVKSIFNSLVFWVDSIN